MSRRDYSAGNFRAAPRFSFIIVSYNTLALTRAAIFSITQYARNFSCEIILADNHSYDNSVPILQKEFPQTKIIAFDENRGFSTAANACAKIAEGEWLLLMNSDVELLPDTMAKMDGLLQRYPQLEVLGGQLLNTDGSLQASVVLDHKASHFEERHQNEESVKVFGIIGAFMAVRRDLWSKLGGMDEGFFFYGEEKDFFLRANDAGAVIRWSPLFRVLHHRRGSSKKVNQRAEIEFWTSKHYSWKKKMSAQQYRSTVRANIIWLAFRVIWYFSLSLATIFLLRAFRGRLRKYAHILNWHLRGRPTGWGLRPV